MKEKYINLNPDAIYILEDLIMNNLPNFFGHINDYSGLHNIIYICNEIYFFNYSHKVNLFSHKFLKFFRHISKWLKNEFWEEIIKEITTIS